jgi:Plasmid pRiA4b ORF-3-like protein
MEHPLPGIHGGGDFLDARKARLDDVLEDIGTKTLRYVYDFGDGWEQTITIERLADPEPENATPSSPNGSATTSIPMTTRLRR